MTDLYNHIETFNTIRCTKCKKEGFSAADDSGIAEEEFLRDGWYATDKNCYCPDCNKKRVEKLESRKKSKP